MKSILIRTAAVVAGLLFIGVVSIVMIEVNTDHAAIDAERKAIAYVEGELAKGSDNIEILSVLVENLTGDITYDVTVEYKLHSLTQPRPLVGNIHFVLDHKPDMDVLDPREYFWRWDVLLITKSDLKVSLN